MSKINKIRLSGTDYDIQDVSATSVVEVTQQQYDDLPASAKTDNILYIITDAQAGDLTNYYTKTETNTLLGGKADTATTYTKTETDNAITAATATKQDTLVSGTNIKTINNTSILGNGNIDIQGGGKAIEAGRGISITTGETADTVSFNLPISAGTGTNSVIEGSTSNFARGNYAHAEGSGTKASGQYSHAEGYISEASGEGSHAEGTSTSTKYYSHGEGSATFAVGNYAHAEGDGTTAATESSHAEGRYTVTKNAAEHASGQFNNSVSASTTFGDSGNTLFSVGNGTANNARHNAFEIRQNGDIYLSSGGTDIKLQDHLGGGGGGSSYTAGDGIDITNNVISVTGKVDTSTYETYTAATATAIGNKLDTSDFSTYSGTVDTAINSKASQSDLSTLSGTVAAHIANTDIHVTTAQTAAWDAKSDFSGSYNDLTDKPTIPTVPTSNTAFTNDAGYITIDAISGKVDTSTYNSYTAATDTALASKQTTLTAGTGISIVDNVISATGGGGGGTVESAITSGSTNAVESKAIWSATTFNKDVLLTFNGRYSTNYPNGCTKLNVEVLGSYNSSYIAFYSDDQNLGSITINNIGSITVDTSSFTSATYEISGTTVLITYPNVTSVTKIEVYDNSNYVYKAVVEGAWVNENTYMKSEVDGKIKALDDKKLDATAYTPTVVDSQLNDYSTNPVQNQALYSELRIDEGESETTLTFENSQSTNYPEGCTKLNVEVVGSYNMSSIYFYSDEWTSIGSITITNYGSIEVGNSFNGASYEISGTTVIITYPTVTNVTKIDVGNNGDYVYKAVVSSVTPLKDQVTANTTALGGKQDTLVSGTNIKTINNQSLLGSGNIDIQGGGGGSSYSAGTGIDITNNVISVSGVVMSSAITTSMTSSSTDAQVPSAKAVYDAIGDIETLLSQI